jgi:CxxC-x17-CxxC domain-containing protein
MTSEINVFAETTYRGQARKFGIKTDDRRRHMYIIGKTGMGKSTILENMIVNDIKAGHGVAVVDPHGDLAEKIIEFIPEERINDVIYFNPADIEYPIALNVIEQVEPHLRHLVASGLIGVFQKLWADSWGPRLEYILRNAILAILDYPGSTLLAVTRMLADKPFRKKVIDKIQDPVVKAFWVNEFAGYADKFASEAVSPIQNKVGQFLSSSLMRNIVGQANSAINIREVMDDRKILILNLSKGRIGEDNSALLGAMMITKIQLAAMSRVDMPEKDRKDFYLYIDEFQNFMTDSFANILSEARKYHLNLIMAHQYIEQLNEKVAGAVFGNVGTLAVFRVGAVDAEALVKEFTPTFTEEDIVNLPKYEFYLKLMIDGISSTPFSAKNSPPLKESEKTNNAEKVIRLSREHYAKRREAVETKIMRWAMNEEDEQDLLELDIAAARYAPVNQIVSEPAAVQVQQTSQTTPVVRNYPDTRPATPSPKPPADRPAYVNNDQSRTEASRPAAPMRTQPAVSSMQRQPANQPRRQEQPGFEVQCSRCSKITKTNFQPDGIRPVFCKECLEIVREEKKRDTEQRKNLKQAELDNIRSAPAGVNAFSPSSADMVKIVPPEQADIAAKEGGTIKTAGGGTITFVKAKPPEAPSVPASEKARPDAPAISKSQNNPVQPIATIKPAVEPVVDNEQELKEGQSINING